MTQLEKYVHMVITFSMVYFTFKTKSLISKKIEVKIFRASELKLKAPLKTQHA